MRLRAFAVVLLALFLQRPAQAQLGVYGKLNLTHLNDTADRTSTWFYGPGVGVYLDFLPLGPIAIGADLRGSYEWGNQLDYRSVLAGLRLVARPPLLSIRPYVQGSAGIAGTRATSGNSGFPKNFSNKLAWEVLGGLDLTVFPRIDLRLPEIGYGRISPVSGVSNGPLSDAFEVSMGLVLRLP